MSQLVTLIRAHTIFEESLCLTPVISQSLVLEHRIFIESMSTPLLISVSVSSCSDCAVLRLGLLLPSRIKCLLPPVLLGFPVAPVVKKRTHLPVLETWIQYLDWKDPLGSAPGNPLQYPCLENPMGRGAWRATVHGVTQSGTTEET